MISKTDQITCSNILGVTISNLTPGKTVEVIEKWIAKGARQYISVCTVHTTMECQFDPEVRRAVNTAGLATPDGMPLVWLANLQSDAQVSRVYGPDLMLAVARASAETGYRHYFYGGASGVPEQLAAFLKRKFPGMIVAGSCSPPFHELSASENQTLINRINQARPDIVWVGLGTPKQDLWMARNRDRLEAAVLIGVGAAFDFHTGRIPQAPSWMQKSGLEWLFRLVQEPRRLWKRYLIYNPWFIYLILQQFLGRRRFN